MLGLVIAVVMLAASAHNNTVGTALLDRLTDAIPAGHARRKGTAIRDVDPQGQHRHYERDSARGGLGEREPATSGLIWSP